MPMWSKPERATGGSYFAAFATDGIQRYNYKRIARPATQIIFILSILLALLFSLFIIPLRVQKSVIIY